jgi:predicted TPR repeat methyltransferase
LFTFSCEALEHVELPGMDVHQGYALAPTGRYVHHASYLQALAQNFGFTTLELVSTQIRMQHGKPVIGWLGLWRRSAL